MAQNAGIRDGDFVRFAGWDVSGADYAYLPKLQGNIAELKKVVTEKHGNAFLAFNTNGWIKSWAVLDWSKFITSPNSTLYVRVEYPGYYFAQGMDSNGNEIGERILDVSTPTGLREEVVKRHQADNVVAGFNTDGFIKSKIVYPLIPNNLQFRHSLAGIYIRTKFMDYTFYQGHGSAGNDILPQTTALINDVPALIRHSATLSDSAGFNTNGWHKRLLEGPPPITAPPEFTQPYQGIYYQTCFPDFVHLPGLDSPYNDITPRITGRPLHQIIAEARRNPNCIAVNTDGWMKNALVDTPTDIAGAGAELQGIYVKIQPTNTSHTSVTPYQTDDSLLSTAFFSLKGTVIIWARWTLLDEPVRQSYREAVEFAIRDIIIQIAAGSLTREAGAEMAHSMRNTILIGMRNITSPIGLFMAKAIKPAGGSFEYYLNRNAERRFGGRQYAALSRSEAEQIALETVDSAGRANVGVTSTLRTLGNVARGVVVIGFAISVYDICVAPEWEVEAGKQVASWTGAIAAGEFGAGVGALVGGPIGAVLGGLAGAIIGSIAGSSIANWFFGGSSTLRALELLEGVKDEATEIVEAVMKKEESLY